MTLRLWVLVYFAVGFVVTVLVARYRPIREQAPVTVTVALWPVVALFYTEDALQALVTWCAKRLP